MSKHSLENMFFWLDISSVLPSSALQDKRLKQNEIIRRGNTRLSVCSSCLPPSATDIGYFKFLALGETDFIGIVGVRVIRVDGLGLVGIFRWLTDFIRSLHGTAGREVGGSCVAFVRAWRATWVAGHGRRCLETVELSRGVHLRRLADSGTRTSAECVGLRAAVVIRISFLVQCERVDCPAVACLGGGTKVEYPNDLSSSTCIPKKRAEKLTMIIDNKIKPAAAACFDDWGW